MVTSYLLLDTDYWLLATANCLLPLCSLLSALRSLPLPLPSPFLRLILPVPKLHSKNKITQNLVLAFAVLALAGLAEKCA